MTTECNTETAGEMARQYATFWVGKLLFGVDVQRVQEVIKYQPMTPVPLSSPIVEGLINLRGQILTAIDLRKRLGLEERDSSQMPMNVVVRTDDGVVSLLVDSIGDVLEVDLGVYEDTPSTVGETIDSVVKGVFKLSNHLMLVLDAEKAAFIDTLN